MFVIASRQPAVARSKAAAERVSGDVQPSAAEVESDGCCSGDTEFPLSTLGIESRDDFAIRLLVGFADRGHQRDEFITQRIKRRLDFGRRRAGFVGIEQCVVGLAVSVADRLGLFALQADLLFEPRFEFGVIRILSGIDPGMLSQRCRARHFLDEALRELRRSIVTAPRFTHVDPLDRALRPEIITRFQFGQKLADTRIGRPLVSQSGQQGELLRAMTRSTGRQVRLLVPAQHRSARSQQCCSAEMFEQLGIHILCRCHSVCSSLAGGSVPRRPELHAALQATRATPRKQPEFTRSWFYQLELNPVAASWQTSSRFIDTGY